ncbi:MAG TPA: hypothetical protein VNM92_13985 [Thermoanaerobaculia bacterium]|nr:hypothetical protein [Thermoanaerobaculia bacterium]
MRIPSHFPARSSVALFAILTLLPALVTPLCAAVTLFPEPLHLTRKVESPIDGSSQIIDEFYSGNRVVSVSGAKITIADYQKQELISIDRSSRTFAVTTFAAIAADARGCDSPPCEESAAAVHTARPSPRKVSGNRETYEMSEGDRPDERMVVTVDRSTMISRDAFDVIVGSAYPNSRSQETDRLAMLAARDESSPRLRSQSVEGAGYGLPIEQTTTMVTPAGEVTVGSVVTRIGRESVPDDLITIPADFRRVESPLGIRKRQLDELDTLPISGAQRP